MVTGSTKTKSNKNFFDEAPPLLGFYYPSPQKCLWKSRTKIAIKAEQQDGNDLLTDSEGFATARSDSANSFNFNESWPSTEHDEEFGDPLKRKENAHQMFGERMFSLHNVIKKKSLHQYDKPNNEGEEQYSVLDSISLDGKQKQILASQISPSKEALQVQTSANKVLKSANNFICSRNPTRDNCSKNEGFEEGLKQNSTLDNSCLLSSDDVESYWRKEHWSKEKKSSSNAVNHISEGQVERNPDDTSVDSSDYLVSSEGLGRWSETNASSEERIQPSFVNIQDSNEHSLMNHYTSDLPFSQYWKTNLNKDVLYQWRIKRRIQLAREQAKSEKQGFLPTRVFNQHQVTSRVGISSGIGRAVSNKQLPQDTSLQVPWYFQTETSKIHTVPDSQMSQYERARISTQPQAIPDRPIPQYQQAGTSSKSFIIPDFQSSLLRPAALDIQSPNLIDNQGAQSQHPHNPLETGNDQLEFDQLRISEKLSHHQKIFSSSQKEKVNAEVQTSPVGHCQMSSSHSVPLTNPYPGHSDSHGRQHCLCFHRDCDILPCKQLSSNHPENHTISPAFSSGSDQHSSGKTTKYHEYLVAEKPHCIKLESNFSSSQLEKKNKNSKSQKKKLLKSEKFHGQRLRGNVRMENKFLHKAETKDHNESPIKSKQTKVDSCPLQSYHQSVRGSSEESSNDFTDDTQLFLDNPSSSDEEFSSDLMLQHLRKQRSTFKEHLRVLKKNIIVKLKTDGIVRET